MLTALWRAILYAYARSHACTNERAHEHAYACTRACRYCVKLRPDVSAPKLEPPWRPWGQLAAGAMRFSEPHLAKMVMLCADFYGRGWGGLYWQVADKIVALYEAGGKFAH